VIFFEPGVKETDWSATPVVVGVDGKPRRWVYLHYFKEGQPSLNWLDPTFAAQQMIIGDALHAIDVMGAKILRLDANGFLGVERKLDGTAWSESHPLSITGNQLLAGAIRKAGGFSFQELNLTVDDIAAMSHGGADLSYDFITRPAYQHALLMGDTEFLRLMLRQMHTLGIDPGSLIHALQNHDELTLELVHFWTLHAHDNFLYQGQTFPGNILREHIREQMYERLAGEHAPYNLKFVTNGVSCTTASIITAALGIRDLDAITDADIQQIRQVHLLLVMYNAMQPGVFALSGWDLVGALPLPAEQVAHLMHDGDTRWIHRGAYDLVDLNPETEFSAGQMPRPKTLYGSLTSQLKDPDSFVSQLKRILAARRAYDIAASRQILIPDVEHPGLLVMVHELPAGKGTQITALNFGSTPITETLHLPNIAPGPVVDIINERVEGDLTPEGEFTITLDAFEGLALRVVSASPMI
jgi:trehalose synthase